jgi:hypothetical protein
MLISYLLNFIKLLLYFLFCAGDSYLCYDQSKKIIDVCFIRFYPLPENVILWKFMLSLYFYFIKGYEIWVLNASFKTKFSDIGEANRNT